MKTETPQRLIGRVVLADDNNDIRDLVSRLLKRQGITVIPAIDGQQALDAVLRDPPDMVLMDMEMPVMDGLTAARMMRDQGYAKPIFVMTAHPEGPEVEQALKEGFDGYLEKPVNRERLQGILAAFLAEAPQESTAVH